MENIQRQDLYVVRSLILMVVLYAAIALLSGVLGVFYTSGIWITWTILCTFFVFKKIIVFPRPSNELVSYILIALSFSLVIAFFTVPTIFSGRDQGSLSEAAMQLSISHDLISYSPESTTFFDIYGRGKALNFPGFFYTADGGLLTQFPLPYITYLSGFFGIFGTNGLIIANTLLLTIFIISITCIARVFLSKRYTFTFLSLLLSSFAIGWFAKSTLSENLASMLLWSTLLLYIMLKYDKTKTTYFTFLIALSLLLFSRIEGIWFFAIFTFLILQNSTTRTFLKKDIWWHILFPLTTLFTISCIVFVMNIPFIYTMATVFFDTTSSSATAATFFNKTIYLFSVYGIYGLLGPLLVTGALCAVAIKYKKYRVFLLPMIITLPLFTYYLFPHISGDHPWMLRRFVFALLPTTILLSIFFIRSIPKRWVFHKLFKSSIFIALLLTNIPAFATFIAYAENATLHDQVHHFSQQFTENDLILIDKDVAGNGWSMITNPLRSLENKHAVYFFNPEDYAKIDVSKFEHVYLVTPNSKKEFYRNTLSEHMHYVNKYHFTLSQLSLSRNKIVPQFFPQKQTYAVRGTIYELKK